MTHRRCWAVVHEPTGRVLETAETEGQVWIRFLRYDGSCFEGLKVVGAVALFRANGFRAEEITDKEAHGRER